MNLAVLNAANEVAVHAFLQRRLDFGHIHQVIDGTMTRHAWVSHPDIEAIREADRWARKAAEDAIRQR